jgi:hypothetical protein
MAEEFIPDSTGSVRPNSDSGEPEDWEKVDLTITSSREGVMAEIRKFYVMGFATVDEWSPLMRVPHLPDKWMSILTRYRRLGTTESSSRKSGG